MVHLLEKLEGFFGIFVEYLILLIEFVGVLILAYTIIKGLIDLFKHIDHMKLDLVEGIALSLEFKMGGELLRTVIVRQWDEILLLGAIILLRAALAVLIHWEISLEKKNTIPPANGK